MKCFRKKKEKLSKYFDVKDLSCSCGCGQCIINKDLVNMLNTAQDLITEGVIVLHSVNRCINKNRSIGSFDSSLHVKGMAADWHVLGWSMRRLHKFVKDNWGEDKIFKGISTYSWGVHTDVGDYRTW